MEETIYKYFGDIIDKYNFILFIRNEYKFLLVKEEVTIEVYWGKFYEDFQITFTKTNSKKEYSIGELLKAKDLLGKKLFTSEENEFKKSLTSIFESNLYIFSLLIKKYLSEFLIGDFSILESK